MSVPPPPPPSGSMPPPPGSYPPGFSDRLRPGRSGMATASLVLGLVGILPFFWLLQIPGLLAVIFGVIGMRQTSGGARPGRGLAIAGFVIGLVLLALAALLWIVIATGDCEFTETGLVCES